MDVRKYMQNALDEVGEDYKLKDNDGLIDIIASFGMGFTEFHTADVERLIKENDQLQQNQAKLVQALKTIASGTMARQGMVELAMKEVCGE